jgi:hypothetical protein
MNLPMQTIVVGSYNWYNRAKAFIDMKVAVRLVITGPDATKIATELKKRGINLPTVPQTGASNAAEPASGTVIIALAVIVAVLMFLSLLVLASLCVYAMNKNYKSKVGQETSGGPFDFKVYIDLEPK